jgi:serpin B
MKRGRNTIGRTALSYVLTALMAGSVVLLGNTSQDEAESQVGPEAIAVYAAVQSELVEGNTTFALDLYRALREEEGNLFFSPYSISAALAMTCAGARGETETQMKETLRFTIPQSVLHPAFHGLDTDLMQRAGNLEGIQLSIANSLWGQIGYAFLSDFRNLLAESYDAPLRLTDFANAPEEARTEVNDWVTDATNGRIEDLMKPGTITPLTRLVLANAIYFKGQWEHQFDEAQTQDAPFYRLDGSQVVVPMMRMQERFSYAAGRDFQAIELPCSGDALSMVILLPGEGLFEDFETNLSTERMDAILAQLSSEKVQLAMPRFELTSEFSLADTLARLGMPNAFTGAADFSGMDGTRDLFIGHVAHKAYVSVNEEGTEAAAATGVSMTLSMPGVMTIDRPFVFLIRDSETGAILFIGRVMDPTST